MKRGQERIFGLDLIRAIAIFLVLLGHGKPFLKDTFLAGFPYFIFLDGVDVFFVLSGFLIGGILLKETNETKGLKIRQLLCFWKRRWFRTLPTYYLVLLLNFLVVKYGIIREDIEQLNWHFLSFTQNFSAPFYGFFWESWSLSVEEWFYIITPILLFVFLKLLPVKQSFLLATCVMIVSPVFYRIMIYDEHIDDFWWDVTFRKTVLSRLDSIGYGLFGAWFYSFFPRIWRSAKMLTFGISILMIVSLLNYSSPPGTIYSQIVYFSLTPLAVMLAFPLLSSYKKAEGFLANFIQHISKISYSMYLINLALVVEVIGVNFPVNGGIDGICKYLIYWFSVGIISTILYKYFEKPIMDLRDKKFHFLN